MRYVNQYLKWFIISNLFNMVYWQWLGSTIFCETTEGYTGQVGVGTQGPTITLTLF